MAEATRQTAVSFERVKDDAARCPNCHSHGMTTFYGVDDIPVHSCLLVPTKQDALAFPRRSLRLGFCAACGFIANMLFDPAVHEYSARYEETQGFSPLFTSFARDLAARLVEQYGIRSKNVLEIGCGKGEFLILLNRIGDNRGIGVDPSYIPERMAKEVDSELVFIRDFYSEKYAGLPADFICCRHTLEHIAPTRDFLSMIRHTIGDRLDTLVFFEVPDVLRVLREGAFWDVYYEHSSYFTLGSLARLFRVSGFEILELSEAYDSQYLLIMAQPATGPSRPILEAEDDLEQVANAVESFEDVCSACLERHRERITHAAKTGKRMVLWGSGSKGVAFLTTLGVDAAIEYVVDINPHRHGKFMPGTGQQIVSPAFLLDYKPDYIVIMNPIYQEEIQRDLDRLGLKSELVPISG